MVVVFRCHIDRVAGLSGLVDTGCVLMNPNGTEQFGVGVVKIDPQLIQTRDELAEQLVALYHREGWSVHRLAEKSGLGVATVQGIVDGSTRMLRAKTLRQFVSACGEEPGPWCEARGRVVRGPQPPTRAELQAQFEDAVREARWANEARLRAERELRELSEGAAPSIEERALRAVRDAFWDGTLTGDQLAAHRLLGRLNAEVEALRDEYKAAKSLPDGFPEFEVSVEVNGRGQPPLSSGPLSN